MQELKIKYGHQQQLEPLQEFFKAQIVQMQQETETHLQIYKRPGQGVKRPMLLLLGDWKIPS